VPDWLDRGRGYFVGVASAAGLLTDRRGGLVVTKHAVVDFAEWLSITHGDQGIGIFACGPWGWTRRC
jgi:NAD(P)-dependent dehydrogenase (short-subunit alcohol dehydrogenase family)